MSRNAAQRSTTGPLALVYLALVTYASLYPFGPWRWPPGQSFGALLLLPWPPWRDAFDVWSNVLGYLPLGALLYVAQARARAPAARAAVVALVVPALWSYAMEVAQQYLPGRAPSRVDWALNSAGAGVGVVLAAALQRYGGLAQWQAVRERWFVGDSAGALALLALWPVALLVPAPVPLGLGHVVEQLRALLQAAVEGVAWAEPVRALLGPDGTGAAEPPTPLTEALVQVLGLLGPCLLAISVARPGWRRAALVAGLGGVAVGATSLSSALSFGPAHALAWIAPLGLPALGLGLLLALAGTLLPGRAAASLALVALTALVVLVAQAPVDPYYAGSLQSWEQGRFIRFNGLALWIGRLWPYAAMLWLLTRMSRPARG